MFSSWYSVLVLAVVVCLALATSGDGEDGQSTRFSRSDRDYRPLQFGKRDNFRPLQFGKKNDYRPLQFGKRSGMAPIAVYSLDDLL